MTVIDVALVPDASGLVFFARLSAAADAPLGARTVTWTNVRNGTANTATMTVAGPAPVLTSVTPSRALVGATTAIVISGANLVQGETTLELVTLDDAVRVVPGSVVFRDDRTIDLQLAVGATARIESSYFRLAAPGNTANLLPILIAPRPPTITSVTPASAAPGGTVDIQILGTNFHRASALLEVLGGGIAVSRYDVIRETLDQQTSTLMSATLVINSDAAAGTRTLKLTTIGGEAQTSFSIVIPRPVFGTFSASPSSITSGRSSLLSWSAIANATACEVNNGVGRVACTASSVAVFPSATTEYQLKATGPGGQDWRYVTVSVGQPAPPPSNVSAFGTSIPRIPRSK